MDAGAPDGRDVLLFSWDGGGNIPPFLALGRRLVRRGHRVRMVGTETIAERARAAGIGFSSFVNPPSWSPTPGVALEDEAGELFTHLFGPELGDELLAATGPSRPDALVIDCMAGGALSMAERLQIPTAVLLHLRARFYYGLPAYDVTAPAREELNRRREDLGLESLPTENWWGELWQRAGETYIASIPELEGPGIPLPASFTYVGGVSEADPPPLADHIAALVAERDGPLVVTSLSTTYMHQERQLQAALGALEGMRGVITVGDGLDPSDFAATNGHVLVTRWLPHEALLPHADVVVTHAGHGTVMAALAAGVPLVCLPMGRDQHGNADQIERARAGVQLDAAVDASRLRAAIETVISSPSFAANARRLSKSVNGLGGVERLATEVERLARDGRRERRATTTDLSPTTSRRM